MLRKLTLLLTLAFVAGNFGYAQGHFKTLPNNPNPSVTVRPADIRINPDLLATSVPTVVNPLSRLAGFRFDPTKLNVPPLPRTLGVKITADQETGQVFLAEGRPRGMKKSTPTPADARNYLQLLSAELKLDNPATEVVLGELRTDTLGQTHVRLRQQYQNLPVEPADAYLHASGDGGFDRFFGRLQATPTDLSVTPGLSAETVSTAAKASFGGAWKELSEEQLEWVGEHQLQTELVIFYHEQTASLAYRLDLHPNLITHVTRYVNAHTGATIHEYNQICGTAGLHAALPPTTATVRDLNGNNVTINTFSQDNQFFLFDVTRPMFRTDAQGDAQGVIHTFDAGGQSPLEDNFDPTIGASFNNTDWSRTAVSVHANAGVAYEYFRTRFERNSIDGVGGTVYSFYNVNNEDGTQMDNAFWGGRAMFYGNGDRAFASLPKALDVAGHEMTHGVIQATANLVYEIQPGAINESMADVFGYLIEEKAGDHRLGEDVVNTQIFTSGALRNLRDPNNGGNRFGDRGWQPAHMDEYVNLANNEDNDNGGVHVNSGIPNRAFFLFSTSAGIGDANAARVYYRALDMYLTRNSQFADLRIAVAMAARDLLGASGEQAANDAFAAVGIGGGSTEVETDIETNEGERFLLLSDVDREALFLADEDGAILNNPLTTVGLLSRPSITDNGSAAFFVDDQNRLRFYNFSSNSLGFVETSPQTIWRNIAVSKNGRRIAVTTTDQDNKIFILDLDSGDFREFTLTNPTTSSDGVVTDNVLYPDVMEWEPGGEFLMYDALSSLDDGIEFWDINFLRAWDMDAANFGDGRIIKLNRNLEDGESIGNPTFSKNSPYIIAFEEVNFATDDYTVIAANIERGESAVVWRNVLIGYPNYGVSDDRIIFDGQLDDDDQTRILATVMLEDDKITTVGNPSITIRNGSWGIFFATGDRDLNTGVDGPIVEDEQVRVYPTATSGFVTVETRLTTDETPLQVFDASGRVVKTLPLNGPRNEVDLSGLRNGAYFLAVPTAQGTVIRRVVRQ